MSNRCFPVWVMFVICALLLSGCSDFDEMKSKRLLMQAEALLQQGNALQAEEALAHLVSRYPATQAGAEAGKHLLQIKNQHELREQKIFAKVLDSYQQVLGGYHALYAEYPRSLSALDQSDYFFNSAYLNEILPSGYQAYLWLSGDGSDYSIWCVGQDQKRGYAVESSSRKLVAFDSDEILKQLAARFQTIAGSDKLFTLLLRPHRS